MPETGQDRNASASRSKWHGNLWHGSKVGITVIKDYKFLFVFFVLAILYWFPSTYRVAVRTLLPASNYYIGELANPHAFDVLRFWPLDNARIDNAPRRELLQRFMDLQGQALHSDQEYVPGRAEIGGSTEERPGRNWNKGSCLFVRDITLEALRVERDRDARGVIVMENDKDNDGEKKERTVEVSLYNLLPHSPYRKYLRVTPEQLRDDPGREKGEALSAFYIRMLRNVPEFIGAEQQVALNGDTTIKGAATHAEQAQASANGKQIKPIGPVCSEAGNARCGRVAIWAYGAPAPCTIWPF